MAETLTSRVCVRQSLQEVKTLIRDIEEASQCKYVSVCNDKNFNNAEWQPSMSNRVFFEKKNDGKSPTISFTGVPFIFIGSMSFECHLGKDRAKKKKERYAQNIASGDNVHKKRRFLAQDTKKIGCPAELKVTRVAMFPEHKILKDSMWARKHAGQELKRIIRENKPVTWENTYYVLVPRLEDHVGHPVRGEVTYVQEAANPKVEERIKELLREGVKSVSEMRRHVREFVKSSLFKGEKPPPLTRYRYYTLHQNLRNIMKSAQDAVLHSRNDQENLQILAQTWRERDPGDSIFIRPQNEGEDFLLCYQTKWQQRLLHLYGQEVCLLDAAHKLTKSDLPLYLLWARTNVCYIVVAVFVVRHETEEAVSDALHILKAWNEGWSPGHFIVDFNMAEINAVESVFTDCRAILCDYHLEKMWGEWIRNVDNGVLDQDEALSSLRRIAAADTLQECEQLIQKFEENKEWTKNPLLQTWFQKTWLPEKERWINAFREEAVQKILITINGIERLNETFKYRHLQNCKTSTLSEMMTVIVNDFIPQWQKKYTQLNIQYSSGCTFSESIPAFLHNRPFDMVMHIVDRMAADLGTVYVTELSNRTFKVTSESDGESYVVTLGSSSTLPSCSCEDWKRNRLPCKHFCVGFREGWTWDDLCSQYRNNPLFTLDPVCFSSSPSASQPAEEPLEHQDHEAEIQEKDGKDTHVEDQGNEMLLHDYATLLNELPSRTRTNKKINTARRRCIERLKAISDSILSVDNEDFLQSLEITLEDVAMELKDYIPHDKRMALNNFTKNRKRKSTVDIHNTVPPPKRAYGQPKHPCTNTVGESAKIMRKIPVHVINPLSTNSLAGDQSDTTHLQETPERPVTEAWCTIGGAVLTLADEHELLSGQWLNDKHINASQSLLREEFPFVEGLNDTILLSAGAVQVSDATEAIQIHHMDQHWLVSSSFRGQVQLYDSLLPKSCVPLTLRQQLVTVYRKYCRGQDGIIDVQIKCTQQQQRAMDSGLFAIANAVSLASGFDPADIQYNHNLMRAHLHACLTKGKLKMFPHTRRRSRWTIAERRAILSKYCICYLYKEKASMVQCGKCQGWYHSSCVNISASIAEQMMIDGYCCTQCATELVSAYAGSVDIV